MSNSDKSSKHVHSEHETMHDHKHSSKTMDKESSSKQNEENTVSHLHMDHEAKPHSEGHHDHHAMMVEDFKKRFFISLVLTINGF